jgi:exopolyphosphatase / guanosine-5'-triphosphate,3'-diphosphate pyrophosphatase
MRLGVLDIGSNTAHLLVVDAHRGAPPMPAHSFKASLHLVEQLDSDGAIPAAGVDGLVGFVKDAMVVAEDQGCEDILGFATSAVRDAGNANEVLRHVVEQTGVQVEVLDGEGEARLTFLAVRRWFGWSSGRLAVFDIGGGSLEIAAGSDEAPEVAHSLPLGAGRLSREFLLEDPPSADDVRELRRRIRMDLAREAGSILRGPPTDHAVATSKTFRSLARACGAAPSAAGPFVQRVLPASALSDLLPRLCRMTVSEKAQLPGVSTDRARQLLAGALVAEAVLAIYGLEQLEICPWALREGVILERLDRLAFTR